MFTDITSLISLPTLIIHTIGILVEEFEFLINFSVMASIMHHQQTCITRMKEIDQYKKEFTQRIGFIATY